MSRQLGTQQGPDGMNRSSELFRGFMEIARWADEQLASLGISTPHELMDSPTADHGRSQGTGSGAGPVGSPQLAPLPLLRPEPLLPAGGQASCRKGCSHCCKFHVTASLLEAFAAVWYVHTALAGETARRILGRLSRYAQWYRDFCEEQGWREGHPPTGGESLVFAHQGRFCPFLEDGLCSIYPARPIACRTFHSFADPLECARLGEVVQDERAKKVLEEGLERCKAIERRVLGTTPVMGPFALLADALAEDPSAFGASPTAGGGREETVR